MTSSSYKTAQNNSNEPSLGSVESNIVVQRHLQTEINQLKHKSSQLTSLLVGTIIALSGLLGWSVYQSIQQTKLAERQATIMAVTSDSVDLARLQSLNSDLEDLEARLPDGIEGLLEQNSAELAALKNQLSEVQATAQSAASQADNQKTSDADAQTIAALSSQVQELNQSIGSLQATVDSQVAQIAKLQEMQSSATAQTEPEVAPAGN